MTPKVHLMVRLLQQLAFLQVLRELGEVLCDSGRPQVPGWEAATLERRIDRCHDRIMAVRPSLSDEELSRLRIARALFLRQLLASAPARLGEWNEAALLDTVPVSRLHEWLSHDLEKLELAILEKSMTPRETARYMQCVAPDWP